MDKLLSAVQAGSVEGALAYLAPDARVRGSSEKQDTERPLAAFLRELIAGNPALVVRIRRSFRGGTRGVAQVTLDGLQSLPGSDAANVAGMWIDQAWVAVDRDGRIETLELHWCREQWARRREVHVHGPAAEAA
ncbi:nuclear transport factor 2 family protein [Panacagrimonas perspica]|uniref:nuclear transport factor 2 family protein n=1 Tax=Panacagrimonas perspica TaxID=381431 RepID=UPI0013C36AD8|nr:nuclear transport factor 2 family protein [Panacagrimonas perspica]